MSKRRPRDCECGAQFRELLFIQHCAECHRSYRAEIFADHKRFGCTTEGYILKHAGDCAFFVSSE